MGVIGIPFGLLLSYGAIALLLESFKGVLMSLFTFSDEFDVELYPIFSWPAALAAATVCALTIFPVRMAAFKTCNKGYTYGGNPAI